MPTLNYKFQPRTYQVPLLKALDNGIRRAICVWHRRSGKDLTAWNHTIAEAIQKKGVYYYYFPTYEQAKKAIWDAIDGKTGMGFLDYIPPDLIVSKNNTELKVTLTNGSIIQLVGLKDVDTLVGTNLVGCVFSEFPLMNEKAWDFIRPILRVNKGWAVFIFTPRGQNHAWKLLQMAEGNDDWYTNLLTIEDTKVLTGEDIKKEQAEGMPQDMIDQEYFCKFIEGASSCFRNIDRLIIPIEEKPLKTHTYQLGIDLAKHQDYTVITPIDLNTFHVLKPDRFNQLDYTTQKAKIEASYLKFNKPLIFMDTTGVGEPVYDDLINKDINIMPYHFTERSRKDLLTNLQIVLESGRIKLSHDEDLINELKSFQYNLVGRKLRMQVPEGVHDDMVMSLALAVWDLPQNPRIIHSNIQRLLSRKQEKVSITRYD